MPVQFKRVRLVSSTAGKITLIQNTQNDPIVVLFPGYTGDALAQKGFIQAAKNAALGVLAVTPTWSQSSQSLRHASQALLQEISADHVLMQRIRFIRAVSFGSYLALPWMQKLNKQIKRVALITPSDAHQLKMAAKQMHVRVIHDDQNYTWPQLFHTIAIRIYQLQNDALIPQISPRFLHINKSIETISIQGASHFTAGELPVVCNELVDWFRDPSDSI